MVLQSIQHCIYGGTEREKPTRTWPAKLFDSAEIAHRFGGLASPTIHVIDSHGVHSCQSGHTHAYP